MIRRLTMLGVVCFSLSACAGVEIYQTADLTGRTGFPIHPKTKPYVLVQRTGAKDKPLDVSIVYLPDLTKTIYVKPLSGFGSSKTNFAIANGALATFGQESDSKLPEMLTAVNGLISARANATKTLAEADALQSADYPAIGTKVLTIAADISAKFSTLKGLVGGEPETLTDVGGKLRVAGNALRSLPDVATAPEQIKVVKEQAERLSKFTAPDASTPRDTSLKIIAEWAKQLNELVKDGTPPKPAEATFELYEIKQTDAGTTLVRVALP